MSNYVVTTNFAAKDVLATGNPAKAVTGAALTTEFNNIATMSSTKQDTAGLNQPNGYVGLNGSGLITLNPLQMLGPTLGAAVDMTFDSGSFNLTVGGLTTAPTVSCIWRRAGKQVVLVINPGAVTVAGTSNAQTFTLSGLPAAIQTIAQVPNVAAVLLEDNGALTSGYMQINAASGTINLYKGVTASASSWTASGTKGILCSIQVAYTLD